MIEDFARRFWRARAGATTSSIRWTDPEMLEFDVALVREILPAEDGFLVDLGCGTGDVFLACLDRLSRVTAVDMVPEFLARIPDDPRVTKVQSDLVSFRSAETFDVGLLFGVVTHLAVDHEIELYRLLRSLVPAGTVIVKNQCGRDEDLEIDSWSEQFQSRYVSRYPQVDSQAARLREVFESVRVVAYPSELNRWENSLHVAFVCQ